MSGGGSVQKPAFDLHNGNGVGALWGALGWNHMQGIN